MATESPLLHDGSKTVAAAAYNNTQSLAGPSGSGQFLGVALSQSVDRTSVLVSATGQQGYGILQNKPKLGEVCDVGIFGITKAVVASAGSTRGKPQMFTSTGAVTDWTTGSSYAQIGYAPESGSSGQIITMVYGATPPKVLT